MTTGQPRPTKGARQLLAWYDRNQRQLPWRQDRDPYRVLVSEFMLQQTRVEVIASRFVRFIERFPTVEELAAAPEEEVVAEWSGLGYYRRARNLWASARQIQGRGGWPTTATELKQLPGVGEYTAAAVASIAFGQPIAVLDGNVRRVMTRLLAEPGNPASRAVVNRLQDEAGRWLDESRPGDSNQALMELGATVCKPQPKCGVCPVADQCLAQQRGEERVYPTVAPTSPRQHRRWQVAILERGAEILLLRRGEDEKWLPGMFELPWVVGPEGPLAKPQVAEAEAALSNKLGRRVTLERHLGVISHAIGRRSIRAGVWLAQAANGRQAPHGDHAGVWVKRDQVTDLPTTSLVGKALAKS